MFPASLPSNSKIWSIHASNIFATVHSFRHSRTPKWTVQVWRTPKQRFFLFYREVLLEHCACWRCFSISIAWHWDGLGMIRKSVGVLGFNVFIKSKRFKKFQKLDSVHMFPASLSSKFQNLVSKHPCPFPYREAQHDSKMDSSGLKRPPVATNLSIL